MLALATGWTPDVLGELPERFRLACHWALYAAAIAGPEGLPPTDPPSRGTPEQRTATMRRNVAVAKLRDILYPADD